MFTIFIPATLCWNNVGKMVQIYETINFQNIDCLGNLSPPKNLAENNLVQISLRDFVTSTALISPLATQARNRELKSADASSAVSLPFLTLSCHLMLVEEKAYVYTYMS